MIAAVSETTIGPECHREHDERDADDVEQEERQPLDDPVGDVLEGRRLPRDVRDGIASGRRRRHDLVAQAVDELVRLLVLRCRVRGDEDDGDGLLVVQLWLARGRHALEALDALVDLVGRLRIAVHVDDDRDRAVEARSEALGEQVVGPAAGLRRGLRALVGGAEAHQRRRRGQHDDAEQDEREHDARVRGHEPAVASDRGLVARRLGVVQRPQERHLQPVDLVPEERQYREQQRVGDQHGGEHAEGAADAELGDEVEAEEGEPRHRDGDGQSGEEHGATRGGIRPRRRHLAVRAPRAGAAGSA